MATDTKINIQLATKADTSGIDAVSKKLDDLQQTTGGAGDTLVPDVVPPGASGEVDDVTDAYEKLLKKVEELEAQLQKLQKTHKSTRAAAEQSAVGIVGVYNKVKGAVVSIKSAFGAVMWWMAAANQASELLGKVWDIITAKSREAKEAARQAAAEEEQSLRRLKELDQAVRAEITARKQAGREMEQARMNRDYEDRIGLIEKAMELEAIAAAARAREANNDYALKQAELRRDLAKRDITQAEFDERSRQAEVEYNEVLRKQAEENAKFALDSAETKARTDKRHYEEQQARLKQLKKLTGSIYHDLDILGTKVSVGIHPEKSKLMTPAEYAKAEEQAKNNFKRQGDQNQVVQQTENRLDFHKNRKRKKQENYGEDVDTTDEDTQIGIWTKALDNERKTLATINDELNKNNDALRTHKETLIANGYTTWADQDANKWTTATEQAGKDLQEAEGYGVSIGTVEQAQRALTASTNDLTKAQAQYQDTLNANESARKKEEKETTYLREGRTAEQGRETERLGREAQVAGAQKTVTDLQRTAEQQQQAAKAQQEVIDRIVKDTSDKDFKTYLDRMQAIIAQQSNEGGYRDRLQQAFEMYKGYISSSPDQLAGKMDEMTEVLRRVTLPYSMTGGQDSATFTRMMEALLAKANLGTQMRGTAQQQQTAGNNLTEVRDATSAVDAADAGVQGMTNAVTAVATAARALRDKSTSPEVQDDLDAIASITQDGIVAANETGRLEDALQSLAIADKEAYAAITGRMQDVLGLVSDQLPTLQAIPPWAGKVGTRIQQLRDSYTNMRGAMATGMSTLP